MKGFRQRLRVLGRQRKQFAIRLLVMHVLNKAYRPQEEPKHFLHCQENLKPLKSVIRLIQITLYTICIFFHGKSHPIFLSDNSTSGSKGKCLITHRALLAACTLTTSIIVPSFLFQMETTCFPS